MGSGAHSHFTPRGESGAVAPQSKDAGALAMVPRTSARFWSACAIAPLFLRPGKLHAFRPLTPRAKAVLSHRGSRHWRAGDSAAVAAAVDGTVDGFAGSVPSHAALPIVRQRLRGKRLFHETKELAQRAAGTWPGSIVQ